MVRNMRVKFNELLTQLIVLCSLAMLTVAGQISDTIFKCCLYLVVALSIVKLCFLRLRMSQFIALVVILISCAIAVFQYGDNPANILIFFTSVALAIVLFRYGIDQGSWKLLKACSLLAIAWFLIQFVLEPNYSFANRLQLNFDNPNMTGIAVCAPSMFLVLMMVEENRRNIKWIYGILLALVVYIIYLTENRSSLITLVAFCAMAWLAVRKKKSFRATGKMTYTLLKLTPLLVMFVYIFLFTVLPSDLRLLGKPFFSGREYSWKLALEQLWRNPFTHYTFEEGTLNLLLEGIRRYGILAMIGYMWVLFSLKKENLDKASVRSYLAYLGFHLVMFQQSFESTLITGSYSVYIWTYMLLGVSSMDETEGNRL